MTNVQFYHLPASTGSLFPVLVNLMDMSLQKNLDVLILVEDRQQADPLHRFLEQRYKFGAALTLSITPQSRFSLCWNNSPGHHHGTLINLTEQLPPWFSRFDYLFELICGNDQLVDRKRQNFRLCRSRGYPLQYHNLAEAGQAVLC